MKKIHDYFRFTDQKTKQEILKLAQSLKGEHIVMINSTPFGGGVAEILNSLVVLMNQLGIDVGWRILKGSDDFFKVTKEFHNALQGGDFVLTRRKRELYEETNALNAMHTHIQSHDLVVVHDPQPLNLINYYKKHNPWILRLHIDLSEPNKKLLKYLKPSIEKYDALVVSSPLYRQKSLKVNQLIIHPSIDPLSVKNAPLSKKEKLALLKRQGINLKKPIVAQISRYDRWKDPIGVIDTFEIIRQKFHCQLVLLGNMASDDPEGPKILKEVRKRANHHPDIKLLVNCSDNDRTVNAMQSMADVVLQKSLKEGFALTVSEAMWKETPVVGTRAGGIPLQIKNGKTGFLVNNNQAAAQACLKLLASQKLRTKMGKVGKEHVRKNFLITRHLLDYLRLFDSFLNKTK